MADDVSSTEVEAPPTPAEPTALPEPPEPAFDTEEPDHRSKFRLVYFGLGGIFALALGGLVFLLGKPGEPEPAAWPFEPTSESTDGKAQEIANFVAPGYRLSTGSQLVTVQAAPPRVQDVPVAWVAIRSSPGGATYTNESIPVYDAEDALMYIMCGLGPECAIAEGAPSEERQRLLRREALELALYTFRYIEDKDYVVAFLPPPPGFRATFALFFQRENLEGLLDEPLGTLIAPEAPLPEEIDDTETLVIDRLTLPSYFGFEFQQLQDGNLAMVLLDPARVTPLPSAQVEENAEGTGAGAGDGGGQ